MLNNKKTTDLSLWQRFKDFIYYWFAYEEPYTTYKKYNKFKRWTQRRKLFKKTQRLIWFLEEVRNANWILWRKFERWYDKLDETIPKLISDLHSIKNDPLSIFHWDHMFLNKPKLYLFGRRSFSDEQWKAFERRHDKIIEIHLIEAGIIQPSEYELMCMEWRWRVRLQKEDRYYHSWYRIEGK